MHVRAKARVRPFCEGRELVCNETPPARGPRGPRGRLAGTAVEAGNTTATVQQGRASRFALWRLWRLAPPPLAPPGGGGVARVVHFNLNPAVSASHIAVQSAVSVGARRAVWRADCRIADGLPDVTVTGLGLHPGLKGVWRRAAQRSAPSATLMAFRFSFLIGRNTPLSRHPSLYLCGK